MKNDEKLSYAILTCCAFTISVMSYLVRFVMRYFYGISDRIYEVSNPIVYFFETFGDKTGVLQWLTVISFIIGCCFWYHFKKGKSIKGNLLFIKHLVEGSKE